MQWSWRRSRGTTTRRGPNGANRGTGCPRGRMFPVKHAGEKLEKVATRVGLVLDGAQRSSLLAYAEWLEAEAIPAGGVGPQEHDRLVDRHVADALVFATGWDEAPRSLLDVGSGVGLPGIPLAITHPGTSVTLLDRSERRCRLARRAVRVLGLGNVEVVNGDISRTKGVWDAVVYRASLEPAEALEAALPVLADGGVVIVGLSRSSAPTGLPAPPQGASIDLLEIESGVLDSPAWLLRMTRTNRPEPENVPL